MRRSLGRIFALILGMGISIGAGVLIPTLPKLLKIVIQRHWLYNIDCGPLHLKLFLLCLFLIGISTLLALALLRKELGSFSKSKLWVLIGFFWLLLLPLKNSSFPHTIFFCLAGISSILIWVSIPREENRSEQIISGLWNAIIKIPPLSWQGFIFLAGVSFYLICAGLLLERIPHIIDEVVYLFQAKIFAGYKLWASQPEPYSFFHFINLIGKDGRWFSEYPPGWPLILTIGVWLKAPWIANPLLSAGMLVLIYRFARELFDEKIARLSSLLGLFSPYLIIMNSSMMAHSSCAFFILGSYLLLWQGIYRKSPIRIFFAMFSLGISATIRPYTGFLMSLPLALFFFFELRKPFRRLFWLCIISALGLAIPLSLLFYYNFLTTGDAFLFGYKYLYGDTVSLGFGLRQFPYPHTFLEGLRIFHSRLLAVSQNLFQTPVPALLLGLVPLIRQRKDQKIIWLLIIFFSLPVGYIFYFFHDHIGLEPRFIFESSPALVMLCALGISQIAESWQNKKSLARYGLILALLSFLIWTPFYFISQKRLGDMGSELKQEIKNKKVTGALILIEELYYPMGMMLQSPFLDGENIYVRDLKEQRELILKKYPELLPYIFYRAPEGFRLEPLSESHP